MASLSDKIPDRDYTYMRAISDPLTNENVHIQQWAWDRGLYTTSGFATRDDPRINGVWFLSNTNAQARRLVLEELPEVKAKLDAIDAKVGAGGGTDPALAAKVDQLISAVAALSAKVDELQSVNVAELVTELRKQIGLPA